MTTATFFNHRYARALTALSLGILAFVAVAQAPQAGPSKLIVSFIDIGQGDAALLQTASGTNVLVDSGPPAGRKALFAYLKLRGVKKLSAVVASHPHRDHIGNMPEVLNAFPTNAFYDSGFVTTSPDLEEMLVAIKDKQIPFFNIGKKNLAGTSKSLGDGLTMDIIQPVLPYFGSTTSHANNNSVVVRFRKGDISFLFTGDQEALQRKRLLQSNADLQSTFYKAAHHGSHNGTDEAFLNRIAPAEAVISCAPGNSHGHPHKKTLDHLTDAGVRVWRTDEQGTIKVVTDGETYDVVPLGK